MTAAALKIPKTGLAIQEEDRQAMEQHIDMVGMDRHRFEYTQEDQGVYLPQKTGIQG